MRRLLLGAALALAAGGRAVAQVSATGTIVFVLTPQDIWPPAAVSDLVAVSTQEGTAGLSWTSVESDSGVVPSGAAVASYQLEASTQPVSAFGGDPNAWWAAAAALPSPPPLAPGQAESFFVSGLAPGASYYFALRSLDAAGHLSAVGNIAPIRALATAPGQPQGLSAVVTSTWTISLAWTDLSVSTKGVDFAGYRVYRATAAAGPYAAVGVSTGPSYVDGTPVPGTAYWYRVTGYARTGLESAPSGSVPQILSVQPPATPLGVQLTAASPNIVFSWQPVTHYANGQPFANPSSPALDELTGYDVYRSTSSPPSWTLAALLPTGATFYTERDPYPLLASYEVVAVQQLAASAPSAQLNRSGQVSVPAGGSTVVIPSGDAPTLSKATNAIGRDIDIVGSEIVGDLGGPIFESVEFQALADGTDPVPGFTFPQPVTVQLAYQVSNGSVVPASARKGAAPASAAVPAGQAPQNLGVFWFNGSQWVKLYGKIDPVTQTASIQTPVLGKFQLRALSRTQSTNFDLNGLSSRILTPNGDGLNDVVLFRIDNPQDAPVEGKVYDLRGGYVSDLTAVGGVCDSTGCVLQWDGKSNGRVVPGGVYVYEIKSQGQVFNGTVVVAR